MARRTASIITKESLDTWGGAPETQTVTVPAANVANKDRISVYIIPIDEAVAVQLQVKFPTAGGTGGFDQVTLDGREFPTSPATNADADKAFVFTIEDLYPGDLIVQIRSEGTAPTRVEVIVAALQ